MAASHARRSLPRLAYYDTIPTLYRPRRTLHASRCLLPSFGHRSRPHRPPAAHRRPFHTSPCPHGGQAASFPKLIRGTYHAQRIAKERELNSRLHGLGSGLVELEQFQREGLLPDDVGLLKGTLVWPTRENPDNVLNDYRWFGKGMITRVNLEARRAYKRLKDCITVLVAEKPQGWRLPKPKFRMTKVIAKDLYRDMHKAFARGQPEDMATLHEITCNTLRGTLQSRITARPKGVTYEWVLHNVLQAKVVSHRSALLPNETADGKSTSIRQAVVRIKSVQSLTRHVDESNTAIDVESKTNEAKLKEHLDAQKEATNAVVTEYLVIQKQRLRGEEEGWKVWGMTEETQSIEAALTEGAESNVTAQASR